MQIQSVLKRDLSRKIEEIVLVDQFDEQSVYEEITDYVVTEPMRNQYQELLNSIARGPADLDESVGVWISGFFGSGKSSFAKILGYVLANPRVLGTPAAELFKERISSQFKSQGDRIIDLVDSINARLPYRVVLFDVQKDRAQSGQGNLSISPYMYRVLLRELDYADDFDIAELEISLEAEGRLAEFERRFNAEYASTDERNVWRRRGRSSTETWNRAGYILHQMDARTYPAPESFARSLAERRIEVTPRLLVERSFELMAREGRGDSKALAFVIDEVGAYVAFSQDRLEDLRAVVELFGKESKNRIKAGKVVAPTWVIVTAQERLEEVTSAIGDDKRVLLAKVQDRFQHRVDLSPADIREVATKRVLSKNTEGAAVLKQLFDQNQGRINMACQLERTKRWSELTTTDFTNFYPYLPHYIDLSIDIMSGLRLQGAQLRQLGGSNRTIISQVYQMLVNPRTNYKDKPVGALVTLDQLYELIEGLLGTARRKDIDDISSRFKNEAGDNGWAVRVARVIALLEPVAGLPRTAFNIAALLVDTVGMAAPLGEVQAALERLQREDFVSETDRGFKLQTTQEKTWSEERRRYMEPRPRERKEILREILTNIFSDTTLRVYNFRNIRRFQVGLAIDGTRGDDAQVPLSLQIAEDRESLPGKLDTLRAESRLSDRQNDIFWLFGLTPEADELVANLYASRQMISKYGALKAQNKGTTDEGPSLESERTSEANYRMRLQGKLQEDLTHGYGIFRGNVYDNSDLGKTLPEMIKNLFDASVPDLYPKLEMGARALKGNEAEDVLKAANLNALPQIFYDGEGGLGLVVKEGQKLLPSVNAPIAKEVLDYLRREHNYGNRVTGKQLAEHFAGLGYGWELDIVRLVLAVLLRAGAIEVTHQGRRFRNHQDPASRAPFTNLPQFRAAGFAPRESIDLQTLIKAVRSYEDLTGDEVDVEEGAIAAAFKKLAADEMQSLLPVVAQAQANTLPGQPLLEEYREMLNSVQSAASDDCVRMLAGEGRTFKSLRDQVRDLRDAVSPTNIALLRRGRDTVATVWPDLRSRIIEPEAARALDNAATALNELTHSEGFANELGSIRTRTAELYTAYRQVYLERHQQRHEAYADAIQKLAARAEWAQIEESDRANLLRPLESRRCTNLALENGTAPPELLPDEATRCVFCGATLNQMESDIDAVDGLLRKALARLQELIAPEQQIERLRAVDFFTRPLDTREAVDEAVDALRTALHKRIAEGAVVVLE